MAFFHEVACCRRDGDYAVLTCLESYLGFTAGSFSAEGSSTCVCLISQNILNIYNYHRLNFQTSEKIGKSYSQQFKINTGIRFMNASHIFFTCACYIHICNCIVYKMSYLRSTYNISYFIYIMSSTFFPKMMLKPYTYHFMSTVANFINSQTSLTYYGIFNCIIYKFLYD